MELSDAIARWRAGVGEAVRPGRARVVIASVLLIAATLAGVGYLVGRARAPLSPSGAVSAPGASAASGATAGNASPTTASDPPASSPTSTVVVHVAGAVVRPGVVTLALGARVVDAIDAAGGARRDADPNALDLAAKVVDGTRVYVPKVGERVAPLTGTGSGGTDATGASGGDGSSDAGDPGASGPVNLNSATEAQLEALPGIGPSLAKGIIDERTRLGGFRSVDDLKRVRGIGERRFADLRPLVTL